MNEYSEATHEAAMRRSYTVRPATLDSASYRPDMDMQLWAPTCEYQNDPQSALLYVRRPRPVDLKSSFHRLRETDRFMGQEPEKERGSPESSHSSRARTTARATSSDLQEWAEDRRGPQGGEHEFENFHWN
jgi:hypothetical protein